MSDIVQGPPPPSSSRRGEERPWVELADKALTNPGQWLSIDLDDTPKASVYGQVYGAIARRISEVRIVDDRVYVRVNKDSL